MSITGQGKTGENETVFIRDLKIVPDEFAGEGSPDGLLPRPVYVKSPNDVSDRRIKSLRLSSSCFSADSADRFLFRSLPDCKEAVSVDLKINVSPLTGQLQAEGAVRGAVSDPALSFGGMGMSMGMGMGSQQGVLLRKIDGILTEETEKRLADTLFTPAVLELNPYRGSDEMMVPTVCFTLEAEFASGERILIDTKYGILIGNAAVEIVQIVTDTDKTVHNGT